LNTKLILKKHVFGFPSHCPHLPLKHFYRVELGSISSSRSNP
jgi:hypothetical protein